MPIHVNPGALDAIMGRKLHKRDSGTSNLTNPEEWLLQAILGRVASSTGISVTPLRMMGIATVFACIRVLSKTMASMPLQLYKGDGKQGRALAIDDPLYSLLVDAPNFEMSAFDFIATMQGHLSLRSNAFAEIMRDGDGDVTGLYPIDPMDISVIRDPRTMRLGYKFMRNGTDFAMEDILHLRGYSRSGLIGIDHSANLQEVFALAIALQDNAAKFFGNGSRPNGVLEHPANLSEEAQERLRSQMEQSTSGRNAYRMMVLEEGLKYTAVRSENTDSQFQEAREYQDLQICRVFGIPPHKVAIVADTPRANVEQENLSFVIDTIRPECVLWEKVLNLRLLSLEAREQGYHFQFDIDSLLRGDLKSQYDAFAVGRQWGWLSVNDVRRRLCMNPVENGDIYLQPVNMVPAGQPPAPEPVVGAGGKGDDPKSGEDGKPAPAPAKPAPQKDPNVPADDLPPPAVPTLLRKPKEIAVVEDASILKV